MKKNVFLIIFLGLAHTVFSQSSKDSLKIYTSQNKTFESDFSRGSLNKSPNEQYLLKYGLDNVIDLLDYRSLKIVNQFVAPRNGAFQEVTYAFFIDNNYVYAESDENIFIFHRLYSSPQFIYSKTNNLVKTNRIEDLSIRVNNLELIVFSKGKIILKNKFKKSSGMTSPSGKWRIDYDKKTGNLACFSKFHGKRFLLSVDDDYMWSYLFIKSETKLLYLSDEYIKCLDLSTGNEFIILMDGYGDEVSSINDFCYFDRTSEIVFLSQSYYETKIVGVNLLNGKTRIQEGHSFLPEILKTDNATLLQIKNESDTAELFFWNLKTCVKYNSIIENLEKVELRYDDHLSDSLGISLNRYVGLSNGKILIGKDHFMYFLGKNNQQIFKVMFFNDANYFVKLHNSPFYMCSKDASKMLHYVTPSLKIIGFEQLDPVYNRPDIVLDSIGKYFGGADQELIASYRQSWKKRIDRLGLDKEKLGKGEIAVPNAEIVGADAIAYENKNGKLKIKVAANDPKYPLRRFNVYVNEVPLYGSAGISIAQLKKQKWDTTLSVPLSVGENKIQVSVMNELGLENFKYPSYVNYTPAETITAKTYYIGIGVNEFKESNHNLKYCVKDVSDLAKSFGGPNTVVKLFTNKQVTKENIVALKDYLSNTSVNDKVIISCSSHGLLDDSLNFYLAMHDVDFHKPRVKGLKYEELENLLDGIPARQKLLLLDACNSGENDKTDLLKKELKEAEKQKENKDLIVYQGKTKGIIIKLEEENQNKFRKVNELFVNVRNNTGSVIISAAGGQQSALEAIEVDGKIIENGTFTFSVLEYLNNHNNKKEELTVNKLKKYVESRVEEITKGKQKPTSRQETMEVDWQLKQ